MKVSVSSGWVNFRKSQAITGKLKNATVSKSGKHWFVSIQVEQEIGKPVHPSASIAGGDLGVKHLLTLSDGTHYEPIDTGKLTVKIKRLQCRLAKKVKFSSNWRKLKEKIAALHTKVANIRRDTLQKLSTTLSKSQAIIVLEDLQIRNMTKSAKGDSDQPGKMVKQKSGLNREILNQGWGMFKEMLKYKQLWRGGEVIFVDPKGTSQTCPECDHRSKDNRLTQSDFKCVECGFTANADHVGALNVLARGHRVIACGEIGISQLGEAGTSIASNCGAPALVFS